MISKTRHLLAILQILADCIIFRNQDSVCKHGSVRIYRLGGVNPGALPILPGDGKEGDCFTMSDI